jgi:hypothetical protein
MKQTLSEKLYDTIDESSAPQLPSATSSKPKTSNSFKADNKKQKTVKSSTKTLEEKEKRKRERKGKKKRKVEKKERKEKESKSKDSTETSEEKAQRRQEKKDKKEKESKNSTETPEEKTQRHKEKRDKKVKDSKVRKRGDKAMQQQKLDIAEKVICKSLTSKNVTQATDVDSYSSDDDSMDVSTMVDLHFGQQVKSNRQYQQENLDGSLTKDYTNVSTPETMSPNEKETLVCMVNTLRRRLEGVERENRQLNGVQKELEQLRRERREAYSDNWMEVADWFRHALRRV